MARKRGSVTLVGGPAGIGKSRLLAEFRDGLAGSRALVLRTECHEDAAPTFGPIRALVRAIASGESGLEALAGSSAERDDFYRAVERVFLEASRKRAIVACIEDLHWADPATLDFLAFVAPHLENERVAIYATYRDDEVERDLELAGTFSRIARASVSQRITLRPLPGPEILSLLHAALGSGTELSNDVLREIVARAAGNPFYAEELLASMRGGGAAGVLPISIRGSVLARFGRLTEEEQTIVSHAAILGYRFDPELLASVMGLDLTPVALALRHARDQHLVVEEPATQLRVRFTHALTQEAIAARMLDLEARPLHARVARILESLDDAARRLDEIAYHWWKARDLERTLATNEAAGDAAMELHAAGDAASLYERALAVASDRDDLIRLSVRAANAASRSGDHVRAIASYERALALDLEAERFKPACELIRRVAASLTYAGRDVEARERIRAFVREHEGRLGAIDALILEGYPILITLGGGGVRAWLERPDFEVSVAAASGRDAWLLEFLKLNAHAYLGDTAAWRESIHRIRPEGGAVAGDDGFALAAIAVTAGFLGTDRAFAIRAFDEAQSAFERLGLDSMRKYVSTGEAFSCYLFGDIHGARRAALHALGETYDYNQRANVALVGSLVGLDLEDARLAELATDERLVAAWESGERSHSTALTATGIARNLLERGRAPEARALLEKAVLALETSFATQFLLPLAAQHVESKRSRARLESVLAAIRDDDNGGAATAAMVRATLARRDGVPGARDMALAAAHRYEALEWPLLQAQALELAGESSAARDIYVRCGSMRRARGSRGADGAGELTQREREVATLVTAGLANGEIAAELGVSVKTVEKHLSHIFERLGIRSRAQVAAYVARETKDVQSKGPSVR